MYVNVAERLAQGVQAPEPDIMRIQPGSHLFYSGELNLVFGDSESGKTWLCLAAVVDTLREGGNAAVVDLDHNGSASTLNRLLEMGAPADVLNDRERFRLAEPFDDLDLRTVIQDLAHWHPDVVTLDSLGEIMPLFKANSNSADDFTDVHRDVIKPLTAVGVGVLLVDHLAKGADSRSFGPGGTSAKKRVVGGASIRVTSEGAYTPGNGGSSKLELHKDRHGGLRRHYPAVSGKEAVIGSFRLDEDEDGVKAFSITPALTRTVAVQEDADRKQLESDVTALLAVADPPKSVREAQGILKCKTTRASAAMAAYRQRAGNDDGNAA
ncbi:hypothetical protein GOPIP_038_00030 [Gordonia polyisoprenivorans NBRC 16320 = JCM 10675]|uniref:AAA family ATPase n=1 Tax=Gordonia polyisoprenivorans TaxID=84595 RepID=A0A846WPP4_9ACTN|nr:AAA family ATPase [Gordonia polyisoprenivorans]NKY03545.1 AAA family ATPase [Gordonia polyisoprenivorans]OZC30834.1 hypothetical protein CJJ17_04700 [Gordonia polyisoprenivorans]GAB23014.1 hypothetical protein GOPIP_038_00030 [Gordonia polyisoprenivorans NBRC 16320 = JCM 10675]